MKIVDKMISEMAVKKKTLASNCESGKDKSQALKVREEMTEKLH